MATSIDPRMLRDDWLTWRRQGVGGSDIAAVLGISPWASPWSVWADKVGLLPPEPENEYMAAGHWLEAAIGPWFAHETGLHVTGEQTWCAHREHSHHHCTVDGFVLDGHAPAWDEGAQAGKVIKLVGGLDDALGLVEIKVTGPGRRWDEVPAHYQAQGQWQMHVTGFERLWFTVLMGRRLDIHELERDQEDIDFMVEAADRFWHDHVQTGEPPATDGHDATLRALASVYARSSPDAVSLGSDVMVHIDRWRQAKTTERAAKGDAQAEAAAIQVALGEAEEGTWLGQRVVSWRPQTRTTRCANCKHETTSDPFRVLRYHPLKETP